MNSNNFDKIYKEIYTKCVDKNYEAKVKKYNEDYTEKEEKVTNLSLTLTGLCMLPLMYCVTHHNIIGSLIFILLFGLSMSPSTHFIKTHKKPDNKNYKKLVLDSLLSKYDSSLKFLTTKGMKKELYNVSEFGRYDIYESTEHVFGFLDNIIPIQFGYAWVQNNNIDKKNSNDHYGSFKGIFSVVKLPINTENIIKIHRNFNKGNLQMDSEKFEDYFDVYTINQNLAMRLLTSDIMNYLIHLRKNFLFEITIKNNFLYIKLYSREKVLEGLDENQCINYNTLYKDYTFISTICELNKKIYYDIQEKDI